ncbi:hypothetical protein [Candidatus Nitronereus thalassa]|uniref:Uncharacterized protein n=1 Tax=Candidatus Nitronereus thalassa TaxID=3020898 RepID=A0ABU3K3A1_9BACT|nr:hypothetical protein [Candidatus Nitronereus thalassa]MDT7040873.1 hypothetical protein [Candidatus Nitronereus thalassa]
MPQAITITVSTLRIKPEALTRGIKAALAESGPAVESRVRQHTPEGVGGSQSGIRGSLFSELRETGPIFAEVIGSSLPYAAPVEFGTKAPRRMPPVSALLPWVERFVATDDPEGVAFLIARSIGRRGTKGAFMFQQGLEDSVPLIEKIFDVHVGEATVRLIEEGR